jgi:predicted aconitase
MGRLEACHHSRPMTLQLTPHDREMLDGAHGRAAALAMRIVVEMARVWQAGRLIDVTSAHVDSCLYHGQAGLDFAERLLEGEARVTVPTTLNVSSLDLLHPELVRLDADTASRARRLMDAYVAMGCHPTWTCAPYQLERRPAFGEHVAWAESNAIVFANSVLGARTNRYGDFLDICAAITGRVPETGLHVDEHRRGRIVFRLSDDIPDRLLHDEVLPTCIGHILGKESGVSVPVVVGLPLDTGEDRLKALGAAAASSGAVAMFHAVGITPEAPTLEDALGGHDPEREIVVTLDRLRAARDELTTVEGGPIAAVSVGTPHLSLDELNLLVTSVGRHSPTVPFYANTGRDVSVGADALTSLADAGVTVVTDTCTYVTPILHDIDGPVMTNSAKWAWYAPANLGFDVVFGSMEECVRSASLARVWRDPDLWGRPSDA